MGNLLGGYSNSKKHCLVEFPHVETKPKESIVTIRLQLVYSEDGSMCWFVPESKYPHDIDTNSCYFMEEMQKELKSTQKAIIMGVFLLMVQNELKTDLEFPIRNLFSVEETDLDLSKKDKYHPDKTGKITIRFEANQRGIQPEDRQLLYESTAEAEGALKYAGLEQRLLQPRSIPINDNTKSDKGKEEEVPEEEEEEKYELFTDEDEMIKFIAEHKQQFSPTWEDIHKVEFEEKDLTKDITHYRVSKEFLSKVRQYFKSAVFPNIHYTGFTDTRLSLDMSDAMMEKIIAMHPKPEKSTTPSPSLFFTLQFNYIVVTTGGPQVGPKVFKRHY